MDITALWALGATVAGASIKPVFDHLTGRNAKRREAEQDFLARIKALEDRCDSQAASLVLRQEERLTLAGQLADVRRDLATQGELLAEVQAELAEVTAAKELLVEHVAALVEQVRSLGAVPAEQPRKPNGQFASTKKPKPKRSH